MHRGTDYGHTSRRGAKFISQINRMVVGYEHDLDQAREFALDYKAKLDVRDKEMEVAEGKITTLAEKIEELDKTNARVENRIADYERKQYESDNKIASLERQLAVFRESQAFTAKKVRKEMISKFQARITGVEKRVASLKGEATTKMLHLGQIDNNLQFIEELQSDDPPELEEEKNVLQSARAPLADAYTAYNQVLDGIMGELVVSPVSPDPGNDLICDSPSEIAAATIGVSDFAGSNKGSVVVTQLLEERRVEQSKVGERSEQEGASAAGVGEEIAKTSDEAA